MKVTVCLGGTLGSAAVREREVTLPSGASVRAVIESPVLGIPALLRKSDTTGSPIPIILLNGRNIEFLEGMDTPLAEGDVVAIFPPSDGG